MNDARRPLAALLTCAAALLHGLAHGSTIDERDAVTAAAMHNPTIAAAVIRWKQREAALKSEEGRYDFVLQLDGSYNRSRNPTLGGNGDVVVTEQDRWVLGTELKKTFPIGTEVGIRVEGDQFRLRRPGSAFVLNTNASGVGYGLTARAYVNQPLLRGFGDDVGMAQIRAARINRSLAEKTRDRTASETLQQTLSAYWEAWYASRAREIEERATQLARQELENARRREAAGDLAEPDVLSFVTQLATREEALTTARVTERQRRVALAVLLGQPKADPAPEAAAPELPPAPSLPRATRAALEESPALAEQRERIRLAEVQARSAGDSFRHRLDLSTWAEARGLGAGSIPPALEQVAGLNAVSAYIGLTYELPLSGRRYSGAKADALLAVSAARKDLAAARVQLEGDVRTVLARREAATARRKTAEATVTAARKLLAAEQRRFAAGASIPVQVQNAADQVRQAELRVARARVDEKLAALELDHAMGALLARYAALLQQLKE